MNSVGLPLGRVRVLDSSRALSGPYVGRSMTEVVEVEVVGTGAGLPRDLAATLIDTGQSRGVAWADVRTPDTLTDSSTATARQITTQLEHNGAPLPTPTTEEEAR